MDNLDDGDCSTSAEDCGVGRIRKRRFSAARIQPTRIKKVMQSDEEIGRMVASVPVGIGSAMEMFAERLLLSAAEAVQFSTTKTLSPMHIKYAVCQNPQFSFLESLLKDVPLPKFTADFHETLQQEEKVETKFAFPDKISKNAIVNSTISAQPSINVRNITIEKQTMISQNLQSQNNNSLSNEKFQPLKRKRGRPPKQKEILNIDDNHANIELKTDVITPSINSIRNSSTPSNNPTILG